MKTENLRYRWLNNLTVLETDIADLENPHKRCPPPIPRERRVSTANETDCLRYQYVGPQWAFSQHRHRRSLGLSVSWAVGFVGCCILCCAESTNSDSNLLELFVSSMFRICINFLLDFVLQTRCLSIFIPSRSNREHW